MKKCVEAISILLCGCVFLFSGCGTSSLSKTIAHYNDYNIDTIDIKQCRLVSDLDKIKVWIVPSVDGDYSFEKEKNYYQKINNIPFGSSPDEVSKIVNSFKLNKQKNNQSYVDLLADGKSLNKIIRKENYDKKTTVEEYEILTITTQKKISETPLVVESKFGDFNMRLLFNSHAYEQVVLVKMLEIQEVYVNGFLVSLSSSSFFAARDLCRPDLRVLCGDKPVGGSYTLDGYDYEIFLKKSSPVVIIAQTAKRAMTRKLIHYDNEEVNYYAKKIYTSNDLLGTELTKKLEYIYPIDKQISVNEIKQMIDTGYTELTPYYFERKYKEN
jgi:hypothetical protein